MGKRDIIRAAKRAGFTIIDAENYWTPTPGEMVREWTVKFSYDSGEYDDEAECFCNAAEAVAYFNDLATNPAGKEGGGDVDTP